MTPLTKGIDVSSHPQAGGNSIGRLELEDDFYVCYQLQKITPPFFLMELELGLMDFCLRYRSLGRAWWS